MLFKVFNYVFINNRKQYYYYDLPSVLLQKKNKIKQIFHIIQLNKINNFHRIQCKCDADDSNNFFRLDLFKSVLKQKFYLKNKKYFFKKKEKIDTIYPKLLIWQVIYATSLLSENKFCSVHHVSKTLS